MYIFHQTETPHGAVANVHRIHSVVISGETVLITINSFANEASEMLVWQDQYEMPLVLFVGTTYPENVTEFLTSGNGFFNGGAIIADMEELEATKAKLKANVNVMREQRVSGGCLTPLGGVDTDEVSIRNILGSYQSAVMAKVANVAFTVTWRLNDNSDVVLDADQMILLGNVVLGHTRACYENSWRLKAEIEAATTVEEAKAILLGSGWPTARDTGRAPEA